MFKRQISCLLALVMILQIMMPFNAFARENKPSHTNLAKVGEVSTKDYPKIDTKLILQRNKEVARSRKHAPAQKGVALKKSDYVDGSDPSDSNKPNYFGRVTAKLNTKGLDNNPFQWGEIFGKDGAGNNNPIRIEFHQLLDDTPTGIQFSLEVDKNGTYKWQDGNGNPTLLPLYSKDFKPFKYSVFIDKGIAEKVKLITSLSAPTPSMTFEKENGKFVADIEFKIDLQQVAATNFSSVWKTDVAVGSRPQIQGNYVITEDDEEITTPFNFPKNETSRTVIRDGFLENFVPDEDNEIYALIVDELVNTPKKVEVKTDTTGLTFDTTNKTVISGDHKYKYDFTYDVINGGKLTMTEILPVTFDANGGKFGSVTEEGAEQKIVKEVKFGKDLTDKVETPTKDRETFKGWSTTQDGKNPVTDQDLKNITKAKTFYAIWDNNDIVAEELTVHESFRDGTGYVNDFIPSLDTLKGQVKIKDAKGDPQALTDDDTFAIVDGTNEYTTDAAAKDYLYNLLKEDDKTEVSRNVTLKAKVTHQNGTSQTVDIPIKVIKNIYEAKTLTDKPFYVPDGYKKVTLDPTDKAQDSQKTYYYVNPEANVVIPGEDPTGKDGNTFMKWTVSGDASESTFKLSERHGFEKDTTITAKYSNDFVEQVGKEKPDVPEDYVKVTVDPNRPNRSGIRIFWVKPNVGVNLRIKDPAPLNGTISFVEWKTTTHDPGKVIDLNKENSFAKNTDIKALYAKKVIPQTGANKPPNVPSDYKHVVFNPTDKATETKKAIYWVKPGLDAVYFNVKKPVGKTINEENGAAYHWTFTKWEQRGRLKVASNYEAEQALELNTKNLLDGEEFLAEYTISDIVRYNPKEPITRPDGYVRVTFEAEKGLKLTESKAYYVKANAGIKLGNAELVKPAYEAETGYKFKEWDKEDSLEIEATDIVVTAKATKLGTVIPEKTGETPNKKPEGYKTVTFVIKDEDKAKGSIKGVTKFYVNPTEYIKINPPATKANTGYEFGTWDKDTTIPTVYEENATITGSFNGLKDVIPNKKPDGTENKKPDGYKTVTFVIDPTTGGKIAGGEVTVYYVNPDKEVTVPQPKTNAETGYKFKEWDQDTTTAKKYTEDTKVKGNFKKLDDIIPEKDKTGKINSKPEGYVTVTFDKGDHGTKIEGKTTYYVNPKAGKKLSDITKPTVTPETGWKQKAAPDAWDTKDDFEIKDNKTVIAQYKELDDVIPKTKQDESEKPAGYITVTFEKGEHGKELTGQAVYYVNPNKAVVLEGKAPTAVPNAGYKFARWDVSIDQAIQYQDGAKITALYNEPGNISETEVEGYVKVVFKPGTDGSLEGIKVYWIKPGVEVNIPAPTVKPNVGYKFDNWNKSLTVTAKANDPTYEITAQYTELDGVIPKTKTDDSEKPDGYVTVKFTTDGNGSLEGTTTYFVNPNKEADFTQIAANMTKKPNIGYTEKGGSWSPTEFKKTFTENAEFKFSFKKLDDVIPAVENEDGPEGYVTLTLIPTDKATDQTKANRSFWVKANTDISITSKPIGKEETIDGITYTHTFKGWKVTRGTIASWDTDTVAGKFIQDTEITAQYSTSADWKDLFAPVEPKDNVVTPKDVTPKPEDLIKNPYDPADPTNKDNLPNGTIFTYEKEPDVNNPGDTTAKVKIKYPNGKTVVVEVPITVVDNVVPQEGKDKPNVPDNYVKVTVDTTDKATDNTKFVKVFWVKPNVEVTIPGINNPTGKAEKGADGVTRTNKFDKWKREGADPDKFYTNEIKDIFAEKTDTKIVALYTQDENVKPVPNDGKWVPKGSTPSAKDFIKNIYNDDDPNNPNNLPPGTKFEFTNGNPDTDTPGTNMTTKITVTYPNGEVKTVDVTYNVTGDVVEQPDPNDPNTKPAVPDNFVPVTVDPTNQATDPTNHVFWVNPDKEVTIPASDPTAKDANKRFTGWDSLLTRRFTSATTITAQYGNKPADPRPTTDYVVTELGAQPTPQDYEKAITPPAGKRIKDVQIVERPNVDKPGKTSATVKVIYEDGSTDQISVPVFVQKKDTPTPDLRPYPVPGDCNNTCEQPSAPNQPNQPNQPNVGKDALNTTDHYQYLIGYPDGNFNPNKGMTRAEAATMFTRLLNERPVKWRHYNAGLSDIRPGDWYANTVGYAVQRGIVSGYPDGSFKPNKPITRAEFAAIASRFDALAQGNAISFSDLAPSHWGYNAIRSAATKGWISGYPDNTFRPEQAITRAEVTAITNRMLNRHADLYWIDAHPSEVIRFGDVKRSDWYFEPIMEATMGHDFIRDRDKKTEHWTGINGKSFI